jgi:hypothetical protein
LRLWRRVASPSFNRITMTTGRDPAKRRFAGTLGAALTLNG